MVPRQSRCQRARSEPSKVDTALCGVLQGNLDIARFLDRHGADVAAQDWGRSDLPHLAFSKGHLDVARFLVEHGANVANW